MDIASSTRLAPATGASIPAPAASRGPAPPQRSEDPVAPARDQVSISPQAYARLAAESPPPADSPPSDASKFLHGTLGLERPTEGTSSAPADAYTYGRFASAALTGAALLALV